jgi:two-component system sensor histidine kinase UhpB
MEALKILIVEDEPSFAQLVQHQLEMLGIDIQNVFIATSLSEANSFRDEIDPDLVLLDLTILDSSGLATYDAINKMYFNASIIILSGLDDKELAIQLVSKGAQDYLQKSDVNAELLGRTIRFAMLRRSVRLELAKSKKTYRDVFNNSPMPMLRLFGETMKITMANPAALALYEITAEEILGKSIYSFNYFNDQRIEIDSNSSTLKKYLKQKTLNGVEIINEIVINKLEQEEGVYIALVIDRTEELKFEKQKFSVISQAEEREKKKIARELHDGLGQQLTLVNLLFQNITPTKDQETAHHTVSNLLKESIRELREISYNLNPPELENGFLHAIHRFANRINSTGLIDFKIEIQKGIVEETLDHIDRVNLYRIIQELVNNTLKHAKATQIYFLMEKNKNQVSILLKDNGVGFEFEKAQAGMGIQNIQYRMKMLNIESEYTAILGEGVAIKMIFN